MTRASANNAMDIGQSPPDGKPDHLIADKKGVFRNGFPDSIPKLGDFRKIHSMPSSVVTSDLGHALSYPLLHENVPTTTAIHVDQPSTESPPHGMGKLGDFGRIFSQIHNGNHKLGIVSVQHTRQTDPLLSKHKKLSPCHSTVCSSSTLPLSLQNDCNQPKVQSIQGRESPLLSIQAGNETQNPSGENAAVTDRTVLSSHDDGDIGAISYDRSIISPKIEEKLVSSSDMGEAFDSTSADSSRDRCDNLTVSMPAKSERYRPESTVESVLSYNLLQQGSNIHIFGTRKSLDQKHESLCLKLISLRAADTSIASSNIQVVSNGIHVFLDMSNINISFQNAWRDRYSLGGHCRFVPLPQLNLEFLTEILVRERKIMALNAGCSVIPNRHEPRYIQQLRDLGYRVDLRERKRVDEHSKWRWSEPGGGEASSSDDIAITNPTHNSSRYVEELVDETLQTRIAESVMEFFQHQGTLVLATGDARLAQYSDGFLAYADRALRMGWNVEVVSWSISLSSHWHSPRWTDQWKGRFRIIELDRYIDELLL